MTRVIGNFYNMNGFVSIFLFAWAVSCSHQYDLKYQKKNDDDVIFFPEHPRKQEIPLALVRQMNDEGITNMQDFIENFVDLSTDNSTSSVVSRIGFDDVERSAIKSTKMARCIPELRTVPLVPEGDTSVFYYPSCTRVERCGGCCAHRLLSCQPVESEILHFSVVVAEYKGGNQLKFRDKAVIQVEQHKKCKCDCKIQPEHCSKYQKYDKDKCSCECENVDDERKCYNNRNNNKIWIKDVCSCMCREVLECSSGFYFDPFHCRCEPARSQRKNQKQKQTTWNFDFRREFFNVSSSEK